jgi:hypothetical protein
MMDCQCQKFGILTVLLIFFELRSNWAVAIARLFIDRSWHKIFVHNVDKTTINMKKKKNKHTRSRSLAKGKEQGDNENDSAFTAQGKPVVHTGSTTQGGSNFGQGSMHLGSQSYRQGSQKNEGSNYEDERGFDI